MPKLFNYQSHGPNRTRIVPFGAKVTLALTGYAIAWVPAPAFAEELVTRPTLTERLTVDVAAQGARVSTKDYYDFRLHDPSTGRNGIGKFYLENSVAAAGLIGQLGLRLTPKTAIGLQGFYDKQMHAPSNPVASAVGIRFGQTDTIGLAFRFDWTPFSHDFSTRQGLFLNAAVGPFQSWTHVRAPSDVSYLSNPKGDGQLEVGFGYRAVVFGPYSTSIALFASACVESTCSRLGLRVGGGFR